MEETGNIPVPGIKTNPSQADPNSIQTTSQRLESRGSMRSRSMGESKEKLDKIIIRTLWQLISSSLDNYKRIDKIKDVLENDDFEDGEKVDQTCEMISDFNSGDLAWCTNFLKSFNRVCKYEKEIVRSDVQLANASQERTIEETQNKHAYTKMLEPLVRYVVARNKSQIDLQKQIREPSRSLSNGRERESSQKAVSFQKPIVEQMQANSKHMLNVIAKKASEMQKEYEKDKKVGIIASDHKERQTAFDLLFKQQEELINEKDRYIEELDKTLAQYKDILLSANKITSMVCFKTADLANTALKNGYYFTQVDQGEETTKEVGLSNEDEFYASFSKNYDTLKDKDQNSYLVKEKPSRQFKPLLKMLKIIHSKKGQLSEKPKKKEPVKEDAECQVEIEPKIVYRPYDPSENVELIERGQQMTAREQSAREQEKAELIERGQQMTARQHSAREQQKVELIDKEQQMSARQPLRKGSVAEREQQTSSRGQRSMAQQTDPGVKAVKKEQNFQSDVKSKKSATNQESQTTLRTIKEQNSQTDPVKKPKSKDFQIQSFLPGSVIERAQQTLTTSIGATNKRVQTNDFERGAFKHQESQTRHWKEVPYRERRDLVTKMYGTVSQDRIERPKEDSMRRTSSPTIVKEPVSRQNRLAQGNTGKSRLTDKNSIATEHATIPTVIHEEKGNKRNNTSHQHNRGSSDAENLAVYQNLQENSVEELHHEVPDYNNNPETMLIGKPYVISKPSASFQETYAGSLNKSYQQSSPNSTKRTLQSRSRSRGTKSKSPVRKQYVNDPEWHHDKKYEDFLAGVYLKQPQNFLSSHQLEQYKQAVMSQRNRVKSMASKKEMQNTGFRNSSVPPGKRQRMLSKEEAYVKAMLLKQKQHDVADMFVSEALLQDTGSYSGFGSQQSLPKLRKNNMMADTKRSLRSSLDWPSEPEKRTVGRVQNYYSTYNQNLEKSISTNRRSKEGGTARNHPSSREDPFRIQSETNELSEVFENLENIQPHIPTYPKKQSQSFAKRPFQKNFPVQSQIRGMISSRKFRMNNTSNRVPENPHRMALFDTDPAGQSTDAK